MTVPLAPSCRFGVAVNRPLLHLSTTTTTTARRTPPTRSLAPKRFSSTTSPPSPATAAALSPRWLSDVKLRLGKCMSFGLQAHQQREAGSILEEVSRDWRELLVGSDGFLTNRERRGLFRHKVVWGEQDSMGHVNNVLYNRYAESGRVEWTLRYAEFIDPANAEIWRSLVTPKGYGLILRSISTEFKFPLKYPDCISVYHKLGVEPKEGSDTILLDVVILSEKHQRIAAKIKEDCAVYDYRVGKKTPMKPFMIDVLRETWRLQEEAEVVNRKRVQGLLDRVRTLETESWDRQGAVEDMGSAQKT